MRQTGQTGMYTVPVPSGITGDLAAKSQIEYHAARCLHWAPIGLLTGPRETLLDP